MPYGVLGSIPAFHPCSAEYPARNKVDVKTARTRTQHHTPHTTKAHARRPAHAPAHTHTHELARFPLRPP